MVVFYGSNAFVSVADTIFVYWVDPTSNLEMRDLLMRILAAIVLTPYFMYFERVKETFVHTLKSVDENQAD